MPALAISFRFREKIEPEVQERLLGEIAGWDGVLATGRLHPGSSRELLRSQAFAQASGEQAGREIVRRLQETGAIADAAVEGIKHALGGAAE